MQVRVSQSAQADLDAIRSYVQADYSHDGALWYAGLERTIDSLAQQPYIGRSSRVRSNVRQLLYGKRHNIYLILYRVEAKQDSIIVAQVLHGMRKPNVRRS